MSAKFDEAAHNGLLFIVFTMPKRDGHTDGRTEPPQRYYIPSGTRCTGQKANLSFGILRHWLLPFGLPSALFLETLVTLIIIPF